MDRLSLGLFELTGLVDGSFMQLFKFKPMSDDGLCCLRTPKRGARINQPRRRRRFERRPSLKASLVWKAAFLRLSRQRLPHADHTRINRMSRINRIFSGKNFS